MSSETQRAQETNPRPKCDHICLLDDGHVERGERHFYGYENPPPRTRPALKYEALCDIVRECFQVFPNPDGPYKGYLEHFYKHPTMGANLNDEQAALLREIVER